ncbi:MAG: ABC transporter ATP-binding protein [Pseudomonadota bacterium]
MSISLSAVTRSYDGHRAVDDVSLDIARGEFFAVLGPSGCGKTTMLRLIAGLETLDAGEIRIGGTTVASSVFHAPPEERNVGVVFQSYALWPHMTVADNVAFPIETRGAARSDVQAQVASHLATVDLSAFADRKPAALSGGQRQRVALARCLAQQASTVLMDEPLANLDPHLRAAMEVELKRFRDAANATVLYITHDQREAMALADRIAVMWSGQLQQVATPDIVYAQPANERVARFIGRSAILDGHVTAVAADAVQVRIGQYDLTATSNSAMAEGPARVMIRPEWVVAAGDRASLSGIVRHTVYRGGVWEVTLEVPDLDDALVMHLGERIAVGDTVPIQIERAWVIPGR